MPTDQNNGVTPNQNQVNNNPNQDNNQGNQNIDLNLEGVELDTSSLAEDKNDAGNLSADNLFDTGATTSDASDSSDNTDDRLLQEDKAVQESESNVSGVSDITAHTEQVESSTESVEQVMEAVEQDVQPVETEGVDLSGLADDLPTQAEEIQLGETQAEPVGSNTESVEQIIEPVEQEVSSVETEGADLSGLAETLPVQAEGPVSPETSETSIQTEEVVLPETPVQVEPVEETIKPVEQDNGSVIQNIEPVVQTTESAQHEGINLNGLAADISTQTSESGVNEGLDLNGSDTLDTSVATNKPAGDPVQTQENQNDGIPADSLTIENVGVPVVEDRAGDIVSDTGDFSGKKDAYVPNESEFQKMSSLLDGAKPGQVELPADAMVQASQTGVATPQVDNSKGVFNLDYVVSSLQDTEKKHSMATNTEVVTTPEVINDVNVQPTISNVPENNVANSVASNDVPVNNVQNMGNVAPVQPVVNQAENMQYNPVQGQGYVYQPNVPMDMSQVPVQQVMPTNEVLNNGVQIPTPKKHHGPSAFVIILISLGLLCLAGFMLYKMYPDVVLGILGKNNISIEYTNNETSLNILGDDENSLMGDESGELTGEVDLGEDLLTGDIFDSEDDEITQNGMDDVMDPDTLTALLQLGDEDTENSEVDNNGETTTDVHGSPENKGDIDTYKDLGLLLDESNSDKDEVLKKLNDYKAQGIIYQDWGTENDNAGAYKYGTYIVKKTTTLIETIETTGEMDMNEIEKIFDTFDGYLSKLEALKSN